ncbi:DNA repair protein endonuclease SAE2/CtIP C-terminus-domain-containing protein [Stachybotrys elegans]|uniref:DNA repair protein endonuclease SAE2/CtIP C-terminus-domain-containing protein n=1 Tax=Stachybotrys elegans TaxID=80388 RepID=A0A8K0SZT7_9HYPO|nr:DNA repair protein endonuclease SAE2/CtIP C-terminus-domain-containing protein [Stachybotrys elegans]
MSSWFDKGRPALFDALTTICNEIDRDLLAELRDRDVRVDKLSRKDEGNASITSTVVPAAGPGIRMTGRLLNAAPVTNHQFPSTTRSEPPRAEASETTEKDWKLEYSNLSMRFNALSENFKKAKAALERRKEERDKWIRHADLLQSKIAAAEREHGIQILDRNHAPAPAARSFSAENMDNQSDAGASFVSVEQAEQAVAQPLPAVPGQNPIDAHEGIAMSGRIREDAEQTLPPLRDSVDDLPIIKSEPSSDTPVVVSTRQVRKRKRSDAGSVGNPKVKTESSGGSSPCLSSDPNFQLQESPDLGGELGRMSTPRKPKIWEDPQSFNGAANAISVVTPVPFVVKPLPQTSRDARFSSALTPISVNTRIAKSGGDKPAAQRRMRDLMKGIACLAEDGSIPAKGMMTPKSAAPATGNLGMSNSRLDRLLNNAEPEEAVSPLAANPRRANLVREALGVPGRRELPFEKRAAASGPRASKDTPKKGGSEPVARSSKSKTSSDKNPDVLSGLRSKPLSELRLDDFKVNPAVNNGHDFAFSEVVRDKDERACLPGCVDMHCCGPQFRALARSQRPTSPLNDAQRREEQELLEKYLGDSTHKLHSMGKQERTALWIEAKTKELADKYGRHRHRFSRMQSPPGFWDADFPSTQELERERLEAANRERATIEQRYKEAMRPGGRWLFRDE